jgi:ABC-type dipeptide/oligopeptide/nickel transport system permease subunit
MSLIVCFLVVKFIEKIVYMVGILIALMCIGLLMIPFNPDLGIQIAAYMVGSLACLAVIFLLSSLLSVIVVAPIMLLWKSLKSLFK